MTQLNQNIPIARIRAALKANAFALHYQPQVNLTTGKVSGMEALIRWHDPVDGIISPGKFMPMIESNDDDLIHLVGNWVLQKSCEQIAEWQQSSLFDNIVSINVSTKHLRTPNFIETVVGIIEAQRINPSRFAVEITEGTLIENSRDVVEKLQRLRAIGIEVHLDDFGCGYSSLAYLRYLPITHIKLDKLFIDDLESTYDGKTHAVDLVKAIIDLGHALSLKVIAEGVENYRQLKLITELRCDYVQGFIFAKPQLGNDVWETVNRINSQSHGYQFRTRHGKVGDYYVEITTRYQEEIDMIRLKQSSLVTHFGGEGLEEVLLNCQTFELTESERLAKLLQEIGGLAEKCLSFPITAVGLEMGYHISRKANVIMWHINPSKDLKDFSEAINQVLVASGCITLINPHWVSEYIGAVLSTPPSLDRKKLEAIQFPSHLFTASRVKVNQRVGEREFKTIMSFDFQ